MMVDMHIHSNYSDGNKSICEIVRYCKDNNINTVSITDHNTIKSYNELKNYDIDYIRGIEFYPQFEGVHLFHLLAYDFELTDEFLSLMDTIDNNRKIVMNNKLKAIRDEFDLNISLNDLDQTRLTNHELYNYLNKMYSAETRKKVFDYLKKIKFDNKRKVDYIKLLKIIKNAYGISVLAHPKSVRCDNFDEFIENLVNNGLNGIEIYHSSFDLDDIEKYKKYANKYNLITSGGSDFHGFAKYDVDGNDVTIGCINKNRNQYINSEDISILKYVLRRK